MNWEAIAAMGEVAGAAGVILSLLYLSRQIGQNTRQMRVATHDATTSDLRAFARQALSGGYARLFARGLEDYESLDAEERLDFAFVMFDMFKTFENAHYHYLHGSMGEDAWRAWHRLLASYAVAPGAQHYWSARRDIFTLEFRGVVDSLDRTSEDVKRVWHATKM